MTIRVFDDRRCALGESPVWHPVLNTLFWVDILQNTLLWRGGLGAGEHRFERPVAALACTAEGLLAADSQSLFLFDPRTRARSHVAALEPDIPDNRANDGRSDPWGGFWIGTMGVEAQGPCGAIYRWRDGELRQLVPGITIPNALCFDAARHRAYFTDTLTHQIMRLDCDADGWPTGPTTVHCDLSAEGLLVDGAVTDRAGMIRAACWDAGAVIRVSPDGDLVDRLHLPTLRPTCVAFGGHDLTDLYVTSAAFGLDEDLGAGATYLYADKVGGPHTPLLKV
ncbi:SMP-30/gluconolactonase/LRE family protein [Caulobacter sp. X]|uniref:SMP-30/gluconolactonase/LRE family protein n=1 Tax=Caulobacter sp. X TaxID=2048901 RepID=UPI000C14E851|nr:SMP-30/gluconolactonase/LRE family protein [Caulobacter sp. X]PIB95251.1 gluconolactonase [Caulobacter sp. X]